MEHRQELGRWGEEMAVLHLTKCGLQILERNWRCRWGEIDIVALEGHTLVVCEVKTRTSESYGTPVSAVTPLKFRRLRRLAAEWLSLHDLHPSDLRFDVIGIVAPRDDEAIIEHLRGVV